MADEQKPAISYVDKNGETVKEGSIESAFQVNLDSAEGKALVAQLKKRAGGQGPAKADAKADAKPSFIGAAAVNANDEKTVKAGAKPGK